MKHLRGGISLAYFVFTLLPSCQPQDCTERLLMSFLLFQFLLIGTLQSLALSSIDLFSIQCCGVRSIVVEIVGHSGEQDGPGDCWPC